jgi:geranylgeranyl pyrophosphate synthase
VIESDPYEEIKRRMIANGAIEEGRQMAQTIAQQAHAALDHLEPGPAIDGLRQIITMVLVRQS